MVSLMVGLGMPGLVFAGLAEDVWERETFAWDAAIMRWLHERGGGPGAVVMNALSVLGGVVGTGLIVAVSVALLVRHRRIGDAVFLAAAVLGAALLSLVAKAVVGRPRPDAWTQGSPVIGSSFPSGHAMTSAALAVATVALLWDGRLRRTAVVGGLLVAFGVGISRVWLGVHYPSDVAAGWCAGVAWAVGATVVRRATLARRPTVTPRPATDECGVPPLGDTP